MKRILILAAALLIPALTGCVFVGKHNGKRFAFVWVPRPVAVDSYHSCSSRCGHYQTGGAWYECSHGPGCGHVFVSGRWVLSD